MRHPELDSGSIFYPLLAATFDRRITLVNSQKLRWGGQRTQAPEEAFIAKLGTGVILGMMLLVLAAVGGFLLWQKITDHGIVHQPSEPKPGEPVFIREFDVNKEVTYERDYDVTSEVALPDNIELPLFSWEPPTWFTGYKPKARSNVKVASGIDGTKPGSVRFERVDEGNVVKVYIDTPPPQIIYVIIDPEKVDFDDNKGILQRVHIGRQNVLPIALTQLDKDARDAATKDGALWRARENAGKLLVSRCKEANPSPNVICEARIPEPAAAQ